MSIFSKYTIIDGHRYRDGGSCYIPVDEDGNDITCVPKKCEPGVYSHPWNTGAPVPTGDYWLNTKTPSMKHKSHPAKFSIRRKVKVVCDQHNKFFVVDLEQPSYSTPSFGIILITDLVKDDTLEPR